MYGVKQSVTILYNPLGNVRGLIEHDLHKTLPKPQKPNWPAHLNSLVFTYNAMPNSTTGLQLYQLMFGCKAQHLVIIGWV